LTREMILTGARVRNLRAARWTPALRHWVENAAAVIVKLKGLAPYALMELVLPGGSVMALLLWLYRRRRNGTNVGRLPAGLLPFLRMTVPSVSSNAAVCSARSDAALG
jgi:hypothetical protein